MFRNTRLPFAVSLAAGLAGGLGLVLGAAIMWAWLGPHRLVWPEAALHASATHAGENLAIATGLVDDDMEGLYVLDYVTGNLQCAVLNPRSAKFNAVFKTNVLNDLGIEATRKRPQYLMVTGFSRFPGSSGARLSETVVYVMDANTTRFAAYGLPWVPGMAESGRPQAGAMILLDVGQVRGSVIRE